MISQTAAGKQRETRVGRPTAGSSFSVAVVFGANTSFEPQKQRASIFPSARGCNRPQCPGRQISPLDTCPPRCPDVVPAKRQTTAKSCKKGQVDRSAHFCTHTLFCPLAIHGGATKEPDRQNQLPEQNRELTVSLQAGAGPRRSWVSGPGEVLILRRREGEPGRGAFP